MRSRSRELREAVVRALAKVGLVWALAVLGALFMAMSAQGLQPDGGYALASAVGPDHPTLSAAEPEGPRTAGLALSLAVLAGGIVVLGVGAMGRDRGEGEPFLRYSSEPHPASTLSLALGLDLRP